MRAVALGLERAVGHRRAVERREDRGELGEPLAAGALHPAVVEAGEVVVERVDEHAERQLALELGRAAGEHEPAARRGQLRSRSITLVLPIPGSPTTARKPGPPAATASSTRSMVASARRGRRGRPSWAHPSRSCAGSASAGGDEQLRALHAGPVDGGVGGRRGGARRRRAAPAGRARRRRRQRARATPPRPPASQHARHAVVHRRADARWPRGEDVTDAIRSSPTRPSRQSPAKANSSPPSTV